MFLGRLLGKKKGRHAARPSWKEATQFRWTGFITRRSVRRKKTARPATRPKLMYLKPFFTPQRAVFPVLDPLGTLLRMPSDVVVAAVQMTSTADVGRNLDRCHDLVKEAAAAGALLVGLPENFAYLGPDQDHRLAIAESLAGAESLARGDAARDREQHAAEPAGPILSA